MNKVILLIPHFQNIEGLQKSLYSIGSQENVDVLVVDDGSGIFIDEKKISSFYHASGKVFFAYLKNNQGIEHALNYGLQIILKKGYPYIARLDCGDICTPHRFKKQEQFLNNNDIVLVGSNVDFVSTKGDYLYTLKMPKKDTEIKKKMYINAMHIHPTILFKSSILQEIGLYPTAYKAAEDYAFFFKVIQKYNVANMDEVLVTCEMNPKGISTVSRKIQAKNRVVIILKNFYFGWYPIYGLFRSLLLYIIPISWLLFLKKKWK
jgi:hypothetical protein